MKLNVKIDMSALQKKLAKTQVIMDEDLDNGIKKSVEYLKVRTEPNIPVDTGQLKASGTIDKVAPASYQLMYAPENPNDGFHYAEIQHENLSYKHTVGKAKYLSSTLAIELGNMYEIIRKEVGGK